MKKIKAVFFDLDHTLWDFDKNSEEAIRELAESLKLQDKGVPDLEEFMSIYRKINYEMWDAYHRHDISKEELRVGRFSQSLERFGISDADLSEKMASGYIEISPHKTNLFPGAIETLEYLKEKYSLHIITNGFREVQYIKIKKSGLAHFFEGIHISEEIGFKKPEPEIFHHAVQQARTVPENCIMIGDNLDTDIKGAINAGIAPVWFNPFLQSNQNDIKSISHLEEIKKFL